MRLAVVADCPANGIVAITVELIGLQGLLSYTWGHSIDDVSSDVNYQNVPLGQSASSERGASDYDIRHTRPRLNLA